ncbi:MAG: radical SAM protein [Ruminococcaceae bacterium]|nr:radical SAM protein [Oscillospiraceae bacterium]
MQIRCNNCPRQCNALRSESENIGGICKSALLPKIAKVSLHNWEEPCISGTKGSGTLFFSGCSLKCVFCQNYNISQENFGKRVSTQRLAEIFREIEASGAHNINLVNPTHYFWAIEQALNIYKPKIPLVYNSGGYDLPENIKKGIFDVYLMDLKYINNETAFKYSKCDNYTDFAFNAIKAAYELQNEPIFDENGILQKGLIVRHLILPQHTNDAIKVIDWFKENTPNAILSIMSQYVPMYKAEEYKTINRQITKREYDKVLNYVSDKKLSHVYTQKRTSSDAKYIPDFNLDGIEKASF